MNGGGFGPVTKADATVGWTRDESIFVFFQPDGEGILDSYLSLTYDGSKFVQGGSSVRYGVLGDGGRLSAVYIPYLKGGVKPVYGEGGWTINAGDVYYSCATGVSYEVDGENVSATIDMYIPDGYVQFAVPATKAKEGDELSCNMVDAYSCVTLGTDLKFSETAVEGKKMTGHKDGDKVYFWGKKNAVTADKCELTLASSVTGGNLTKSVSSSSVSANNAYNTDFHPDGALPGAFSVSPTKRVFFSQGNLIATIDDSRNPIAWRFATNQYDTHAEESFNRLKDSTAGDIDLFDWSNQGHNYGISDAFQDDWWSNYYPPYVFQDWGIPYCESNGITPNTTWRTLSEDEWTFLFYGKDELHDGQFEIRVGKYKAGVTVCGKEDCYILAPDNWNLTANPLQSEYNSSSSPMTWEQAEAAGLVCLPSSGSYADYYGIYFRNYKKEDVEGLGTAAYWTSSMYSYDQYLFLFLQYYPMVAIHGFCSSPMGICVRLVTNAD